MFAVDERISMGLCLPIRALGSQKSAFCSRYVAGVAVHMTLFGDSVGRANFVDLSFLAGVDIFCDQRRVDERAETVAAASLQQ